MKLHTKHQGSGPCGFTQEDFFYVFPIISLCITCDPWGGPFWPQGHNLNKLGKIHEMMLHIKYQGSSLSLVVSDKIFSGFPYKPIKNM